MKATRSKIGNRRSHRRVTKPTLVSGTQAGTLRRRHFADPHTGLYRGKPIAVSPVSSENRKKKSTIKKSPSAPAATTKKSARKKTSADIPHNHNHADTA